jgi:repressor of nif and glnA expression
VLPVIPIRNSRKKRVGAGCLRYHLRRLVERCFNKLKKNARRDATHNDENAEYQLKFINNTSIQLW